MSKTQIEKLSDKLVRAFLSNKIIAPLPLKYTKKLITHKSLENFVKVKLINQLLGLKQLEQHLR